MRGVASAAILEVDEPKYIVVIRGAHDRDRFLMIGVL